LIDNEAEAHVVAIEENNERDTMLEEVRGARAGRVTIDEGRVIEERRGIALPISDDEYTMSLDRETFYNNGGAR